MREQLRYQLWIVAAAGVIFFTHLGATALWDMDEALYTTCAREMLERGDWIEPWFNGEMFPEKPPLMFWTMMAGFELFGGVSEFAARFFSALMGVGTALAAFHLGRILFNIRIGLWTGLITASTIVFTISARAATVDSALTFFTTLAFLLFVTGSRFFRAESQTSDAGSPWCAQNGLTFFRAVLMYACVGVTVLGKGPVGMVLPLAAMGLYLLVVGGWRKLLWSAWWMRPLTALVVIAAVALPWYVWVGIQTDGRWLREFFFEFNLRPFKQPILGHGDASSLQRTLAFLISLLYYFYHIPALLVGFFPWSVFLGPTLIETFRRVRRGTERGAEFVRQRNGCLLALCWFGVWFVFWSICKTKLPHYLLPAYPALAMLTACFVDRWLSDPASLRRWWLRNAWISTIFAGVGIAIAVPVIAAIYLPGEEWIGSVGVILVLGGGVCWWSTAHGRHQRAATFFTVMSVAFLTAVFGYAAQRVDRHQNAIPMIAAIRADSPQSARPPIATYRFFRESTVCYAGYSVTRCDENQPEGRSAREELARFIAGADRSYVITTDEYESEINEAFPGKFRVIFRHRRFLGPGEMVVLGMGSESGD